MNKKWNRPIRRIHYWGAMVCALPVILVLVTGILLLLKKQSDWIQPPTVRGSSDTPTIAFPAVLAAASTVPEAGINRWEDIDRLDVRPGKGVIKVRSNSNWEIQLDQQSGEILQVAFRRSDIIESIHDGSFFHTNVTLGVFLPSAVVLLTLWLTGLYMFVFPLLARRKAKKPIPARTAP